MLRVHDHSHINPQSPCAQLGGMGFVHYNNSIEDQVQHVMRVKRHRLGYDIKPMVLPPTATIMQMDLLRVGLCVCVNVEGMLVYVCVRLCLRVYV